jgi:hypothetical protein
MCFASFCASIASGNNVYGAGKLLSELGCERGHGGLLAVATFSEILAFHVLHMLPGVQYHELVDNVKSKSRHVAQIVSRFVTTYYTSTVKKPRHMVFNDIAFYCLPGMSYVRTALRRIGILGELEWNSHDHRFANDFATSLMKLASSSNIDPATFPFTCAQSVIGGVPVAIKSRMGADYTDSTSAQIVTLCHSYKRIQIITDTVKSVSGDRNVVCIRVDCICSRPIVLKMAAIDQLKTMQFIKRVSLQSPQSAWSKPKPPLNSTLLKHRLAGMRMNINENILIRSIHRDVYDELVDTMSALDTRGLASITDNREAIFMIPFGVYGIGTTADVACLDFEMRPVWVNDLRAAAINVRRDTSTPPTTRTDVTVRMDGSTLDGRPRHPFAIIASNDYVSLYVDDESSKNDVTTKQCGKQSPVEIKKIDSLVDAIALINNDCAVSDLSGELSEGYRSIMHNAERVFQACLIIASGNYCAKPPQHGIVAQIDLKTIIPPANLAVSICIGNALAYAATGMPVRIVASFPDCPTDMMYCMKTAAGIVESACDALTRKGLMAVPFSEVCCSLSCIHAQS